jgi:hypothetical protein
MQPKRKPLERTLNDTVQLSLQQPSDIKLTGRHLTVYAVKQAYSGTRLLMPGARNATDLSLALHKDVVSSLHVCNAVLIL